MQHCHRKNFAQRCSLWASFYNNENYYYFLDNKIKTEYNLY